MEERTCRILYEINEETAKYYYTMLRSNLGETGTTRLKSIGLTEETVDRFRLGYTGESKRGLVDHLRVKGYLDDQIIEAGLADKTSGNIIEDKFQTRIMIPIIDDEYRVIGFSGRTVNDGMPKYLNSSETVLFHKNCSLFGIDHVKDSAAQYIILCEGYMDVMALRWAGFDMGVASPGTDISVEHAELLKKYTKDVIICFDDDEFGNKKAEKALAILGQAGIKAKKLNLYPYKDPLGYITKEGGTAFGELLRTVLE